MLQTCQYSIWTCSECCEYVSMVAYSVTVTVTVTVASIVSIVSGLSKRSEISPIKRTTPMAHRKAQVDQTVPRSHADFADAWPLLDHLRAINCVPRQTLLRIVGAINCGRAANVVLPRVVRRQR